MTASSHADGADDRRLSRQALASVVLAYPGAVIGVALALGVLVIPPSPSVGVQLLQIAASAGLALTPSLGAIVLGAIAIRRSMTGTEIRGKRWATAGIVGGIGMPFVIVGLAAAIASLVGAMGVVFGGLFVGLGILGR